VDNVALKNRLQNKKLKTVVLDVWEHEPTIDTDLLARVFLGTPHIAGYSLDGKANGTQMIYNAVCHFLNVPPQKKVSEFLPPPPVPEIVWTPSAESDEIQIRQIVRKIYDIRADDARLRRLEDVPKQEQGGYFDHLRKTYPVRREFGNTRVILPELGQTGRLAHKLRVLGFQTEETNTKP
jgi:erythronate-4-phosphate dehydrogenase